MTTMKEATRSLQPFETTNKGILVTWKTVTAIALAVSIGGGGASTVLSQCGSLGPGSEATAKALVLHSAQIETLQMQVKYCSESIAAIKETLTTLESLSRIQVATEEARAVTATIRNQADRAEQFARLLRVNIARLSANPPKEPCYNLVCE